MVHLIGKLKLWRRGFGFNNHGQFSSNYKPCLVGLIVYNERDYQYTPSVSTPLDFVSLVVQGVWNSFSQLVLVCRQYFLIPLA